MHCNTCCPSVCYVPICVSAGSDAALLYVAPQFDFVHHVMVASGALVRFGLAGLKEADWANSAYVSVELSFRWILPLLSSSSYSK